jgi:arylformamidase
MNTFLNLIVSALLVTFLGACASTTVQGGAGETYHLIGTKKLVDFPYGDHPRQRMDIYMPEGAKNAPVIMMLYGAGYYEGDKSYPLLTINKLKRWGLNGFIIISLSTRNLPQADAYVQVQDLALAVATAQQHATEWGGDPHKFFIMGHSSGGQLISLLGAKPSMVTDLGGQRWLAGVALDPSSLNIPQTMTTGHADFFDPAFGNDPSKWPAGSPFHQLSADSIPLLVACSIPREDAPCIKAEAFADQAKTLGVNVVVLPLNLNHGEVNDFLGLPGEYTRKVEQFMASTHPEVAHLLGRVH